MLQVKHRETGALFALKVLPFTVKGKQEADLHYKCSFHSHVAKVADVFENDWQGRLAILFIIEL